MAKAAFKSYYDRPESTPTATGTMYDNTYTVEIGKTGHKVLAKTGKTNRYDKVQLHKEECLVENILVRASMDPSLLEKKVGQYIDTTKMPKTLAEAQNIIIKAKNEFAALPIELRRKFDNSPEKYISEYGSQEWAETMGITKKEVVKEVIKEEKKKEEKVSE